MTGWRLLADIGGTNARFARADENGTLFEQRAYRVAEYPDFTAAVDAYLAETGGARGCLAAAAGAAGPQVGGAVKLTNAPWLVRERDLSRAAGDVPARVLNDLEAVAHGLPYLTPQDVAPFGPQTEPPDPARRMLAINVGTGFGACALFRTQAGWETCPGEAGHMSFGGREAAELDLLDDFAHPGATVEDVLSGNGLLNLYVAQCERLGTSASATSVEAMFARIADDPAAQVALRHFTIWLGRVSGDLALATTAWDGVYLTGGVVEGWHPLASPGLFRIHFEGTSKMRARLVRTYTAVITRTDIAFLGLTHAPVARGADLLK